MASALDFRHVETDKIGRGKRVLKPPGGECSDIFGTQSTPAYQDRRQVKQHQQSSIFGGESNSNQSPSGKRDADTQNRLFGRAPEESSPRRIVDRMKSNVFGGVEESNTNHSPSVKKLVRRNPITGEIDEDEDNVEENGLENGSVDDKEENPITGEGTAAVSPNQTTCVKIKNPPGGKSSGIF